jgi:hypothetical protein
MLKEVKCRLAGKKLSADQMKEIKGGDWTIFCRIQCSRAYQACVNSGGWDCDYYYSDCLDGCSPF